MRGVKGPSGSAGIVRNVLTVGAGTLIAGPVMAGVMAPTAHAAPVDSVSPHSKSSVPNAPSVEYTSLARAMDAMNAKNSAWNGCSRGTIEILETGSTLTADAIPELPLHVSLSEAHECLTHARSQLGKWVLAYDSSGGVRALQEALDEAIDASVSGNPDTLRAALKNVAHRAEEAKTSTWSDSGKDAALLQVLLLVFGAGLIVLTTTDGHKLW